MSGGLRWIGDAIRVAVRSPAHSITAIATMALGVGVSTAALTVADALMWRPFPVRDQERLVVMWGERRDGGFANVPVTVPWVREFVQRAPALDAVATFAFRGASPVAVRAGDRVLQLKTSLVGGTYFDVLGSRPLLGRAFGQQDDLPGAAPVVVLTYRTWRDRFGGDSAVVGKTVEVISDGREHQVVGVMPPGLEYPRGTEVWAPLTAWSAAGGFREMAENEVDMLARLAPNGSMDQARRELSEFFGRPGAPPIERELRGFVAPLTDVALGSARPAMVVLSVVAVLLLLISAANVANLHLVRSIGRVREFAVRQALGATRRHIARQMFADAALPVIVGGIMGWWLAGVIVAAFQRVAPASIPRLEELHVGGWTLAIALASTLVALGVSGVTSLVHSARVDTNDALRAGARAGTDRRTRWLADGLVGAQVALAAASLMVAVLVIGSFYRLTQIPLAFDASRLLAVQLAFPSGSPGDPASRRLMLERLTTRLAGMPSIETVTPVLNVPFIGAGGGIDGRAVLPDQDDVARATNPISNFEIVDAEYFDALAIRSIQGRTFTDADREGVVRVVVVSQSVARHYWPAGNALGGRLRGPGGELEVIGVVPDTRYRELEVARPTIYFPFAQSPFPISPSTLLIRTALPADAISASIRRAVVEEDASVVVTNVASLQELLDGPRAIPRMNALVLTLFGSAALCLAAVGLFGVIGTMVRMRTKELGVRLALGATPARVRRSVVGHGLRLGAIGALVGIVAAQATGAWLKPLLYDTRPTEILPLALVAVIVLVACAAASYLPARRGARVDPMVSLRNEN